jgi:hypothetical protein
MSRDSGYVMPDPCPIRAQYSRASVVKSALPVCTLVMNELVQGGPGCIGDSGKRRTGHQAGTVNVSGSWKRRLP